MPDADRSPAPARPARSTTASSLPAGRYRLGEPGEERTVALAAVAVGRYPVANAHWRAFALGHGPRPSPPPRAAPAARGPPGDRRHAATTPRAFCAWAAARLGAPRPPARPPDEWEAAARGPEARTWPWGDTFDPERCNCAEAAWGWTVPVTAHPDGASPAGAEQLAGNVWEWVAGDRPPTAGRTVRGGSYLDTAWGVRASRALPADPAPRHAPPPASASPSTPTRRRLVTTARAPDPALLMDALRDVYDPCCADRGVSIVDMGIVEDVRVADGHAEVDLVLTSGWCPFVASMSSAIPDRLRAVEGVETCDVRVVWDPVWTMERLSPSAREKLAMPLARARALPRAAAGRDRKDLSEPWPSPNRSPREAGARKVDAFVFDCVCHVFNFDKANALGPPGELFDEHLYAFHTLLTREGERVLSREEFFREWSVDEIYEMVIEGSDTDMIAAQPLPLTDLFHDGLSAVGEVRRDGRQAPGPRGVLGVDQPARGQEGARPAAAARSRTTGRGR